MDSKNDDNSGKSKKDIALEKLAKEVAEAREDVKMGRVYTMEQVCKELGLE